MNNSLLNDDTSMARSMPLETDLKVNKIVIVKCQNCRSVLTFSKILYSSLIV